MTLLVDSFYVGVPLTLVPASSFCKKSYIHQSELYYYSSAGKMLGQILVTKQTGPEGKIVSKVTYKFKPFFACNVLFEL